MVALVAGQGACRVPVCQSCIYWMLLVRTKQTLIVTAAKLVQHVLTKASKLLELSIAGCTRAGANTTDRSSDQEVSVQGSQSCRACLSSVAFVNGNPITSQHTGSWGKLQLAAYCRLSSAPCISFLLCSSAPCTPCAGAIELVSDAFNLQRLDLA